MKNTRVAVSAFAIWTPLGTWVNAKPLMDSAAGPLAPWAEAPVLSTFHQGSRRPNRQAVILVQLTQALLSARAAAGGEETGLHPQDTDFLLGTSKGSAEADVAFVEGLLQRGSGLASPSTFVYTLPTAAPAEVALALGLRGALATLAAGTVGGLFAVARAATNVARGRSRACIAGGVELGGVLTATNDREGEFAALFLLEGAQTPEHGTLLTEAEFGFSVEKTSAELAPSSLTPLLELAATCAERDRPTPREVFGSSREGYWARLRCSPCPDGAR